MLNYTESESYKQEKPVLHFVLMVMCLALIIIGALLYFD